MFRGTKMQSFRYKLTVLFYMDECTGGNVLATASNKRMYFFYAAIKELGYLNCKTAFLPWACIPAKDLSLEDGPTWHQSPVQSCKIGWRNSLNKAACCMVDDFECFWNVCLQITMRSVRFLIQKELPHWNLVRCAAMFWAKHEQKSTVILSSWPSAHAINHALSATAWWNSSQFTTKCCTRPSTWQRPAWRRKKKYLDFSSTKTVCLQIPTSEWSWTWIIWSLIRPTATMPTGSQVRNCCWWCKSLKEHGITTEMWQQTIRDVPWRCRDEHFRAPSARAFLFQQSFWSGEMFKGSASQVWFLLPWFHFHMHQLAVDHNASEWKSFGVLLKCHYALRAIRNGAHDYEKLNQAQLEHHHWFGSTWGDLLRPKHHLRVHLASIYRKFGYADAFPCEKKHQDYKTMLSQTQACLYKQGTGKISLYILGRMLLQNPTELEEKPWSDGMIPPIHSEEEVSETFPGFNARVSRGYRLGSITLTPDTPVLWANFSGIVQFFALEKNIIFMIYEELEPLESTVPWSKRFQCTGRWNAINVTSLASSNVPC